MNDYLQNCTMVITVPVAWGEMDAMGHVNNIIYFRYFESVRIAYFQKLKLNEFQKRTGVGPILASTECRFKMPLHYPDTISIGTKVLSMEEDRFVMGYEIFSHSHSRIVADGEGVIVTYDYNAGKKVPIPEELKKNILEMDKIRTEG